MIFPIYCPYLQYSTNSKEVRVQALRDKLQQYQLEYAMTRHRTDRVDGFLDNLSDQDRRIVTDVYMNNIQIEAITHKIFLSKKTVKRRIDDIMINFRPTQTEWVLL